MLYSLGNPSIIPDGAVPSTVELLAQSYVFSQSSLLTDRQFIAEAKKRGVSLEAGELEELHRRRVLVPFYRVHPRAVGAGRSLAPDRQVPGEAWRLYQASRDGRLTDPAERPFRKWTPGSFDASVYYSHYQLLSLRGIPLLLTRMQSRRQANGRIAWDLPPLKRHERLWYANGRPLAIVLEVLSPRYRPRILHTLRSPDDDFMQFVDDLDPANESAFLRLDPAILLRQAENLLLAAKAFDPLGKWHRVTRIASRNRWEDLRFDALLAQEYRVAAEIILQFLEDEAAQGRATPLKAPSDEWREPVHDRLTVDQRERAETVMDFHLSDRPAVYLAVEGETEATIVAKVLDLAGFERLSPWVSVVDLEGVGGDVKLLARAVAVPRLDPEGHHGARVVSPLTALVVVTDPEGKYSDDDSRVRALDAMKDAVIKSLPKALRTSAMRRDLEYLIHLRTWDEEFEFAHFSNTELAAGLRAVTRGGCPSAAEIRKALQKVRAARGPFRSVWKNWPIQPSKVELAEALWPTLERRILNVRSRRPIPVISVVQDAIRISYEVRRAREVAVED